MREENEVSLLDEMKEYGFDYDEERDVFIDEDGRVARILYFKNKPKAYGFLALNHEYVPFNYHIEDKQLCGKATEENGLISIEERLVFTKVLYGCAGDYRPDEINGVKE